MEKIIIYKNKGEVFRCQLEVNGADTADATTRLCIEFKDHKNIYFNGEIDKEGICTFQIPKLTEFEENTEAKMFIEVIADDTYFKVYEADVELKNSVNIKLTQKNMAPVVETKVKITEIVQESKLQKEDTVVKEEVVKEEVAKKEVDEWQPLKDIQKKKKKPEEPIKKENNGKLPSFSEFMNSK